MASSKSGRSIDGLLGDFSGRRPLRAGSLIVTVFGDSIAQHGNSMWLGSLISILEPFGLNARQIRTAVFRLAREGWLMARQVGRKSYYSLTETGLRHCAQAARRIYASGQAAWDGKWTIVITTRTPARNREHLRRELRWLGYGTLIPGVLAHPSANHRLLEEVLRAYGTTPGLVVMEARTQDLASQENMKELCRECWKLDRLAARYLGFLQTFRPVYQSVQMSGGLSDMHSFRLRTLLIHEYRRILLHDTDLPDELLPGNWTGRMAFNLTGNIYRRVQEGTERYLCAAVESIDGPFPGPEPEYFARFGGLGAEQGRTVRSGSRAAP